MKWFRLWTDIIDDIKTLQLTDYEFRIFIYLMAHASEVESTSGELQSTFTSLSVRFRLRFNHFSHAIETFQKLGLVSINEAGNIVITNWSKRQFRSDNVYERVKKYREVNKKRNVSETDQRTETDTDTENREKKKNKKKSASSYSEDFESFFKAYPNRTAKKSAFDAWKKAKASGQLPSMESLIYAIENQKRAKRTAIKTGKFAPEWPDPERWIKKARWEDEIIEVEDELDLWKNA